MKPLSFWQRVRAYFSPPEGNLQTWREYLLNIVLVIFLVLGSLAYVSSMRRALQNGILNLETITFTLAFGLLFVVTFFRRLPFKFRAGTLIGMMYALSIVILLSQGLFGSGRIWLFAFSSLVVMLFGLGPGIVSIVLNVITLAIVTWQISSGNLDFDLQPVSDWVNTSITFLMLNTVTTVSQGVLMKAFEINLAQAQALALTLEQRVTDRTRAIETSVQVSRQLSTILDPTQLVSEIVNQIQQAFNYYHTHIYMFDSAGKNLVMVSGTGEVGRMMLDNEHKIEQGQGLVGRAAATNAVVLAPDVTQEKGWLSNPLLPETKSEIAVPIAVSDRVLGVLDVQQNTTDGLTEEDANLLQSIANQVAIVLRNAGLFEETQKHAEREALLNMIGQSIQTASDVEGVLRIAARELGQALGTERASVQLHNPGSPISAHTSNGGSSFPEKLT